jgi:ATP-dependent DNA helicase PIF1
MTQDQALSILKTGANVFLTGEPGSGKTHTVNRFVSWLREHDIQPAVTASTGIAATHIGGYTIHSWSGIGVKDHLSKQDLSRIRDNKRVARRVRSASTLIIDEVSMLSASTFEAVEASCRHIRENSEKFGGMQVVLVGDFFQLPPIVRPQEVDSQSSFFPDEAQAVFAFDSPLWKELGLTTCYLHEQHRQEDPKFLELLTAVRSGNVLDSHRETLRTRYAATAKDGITKLFPHNANVDRINDMELQRLPGKPYAFIMESHGTANLAEHLKKNCLSPEKLVLKVGARVLFTKNDPEHRFVNGTLGTVTGFSEAYEGNPIIKTMAGREIIATPAEWRIEDESKTLAHIVQIPLRLAWAITIHKSQGLSLDAAHMDLAHAFEYGQGYVAISRVRTLAGLSLVGVNERALEVNPQILERDGEFRAASDDAEAFLEQLMPMKLQEDQDIFIKSCGGRIVNNGHDDYHDDKKLIPSPEQLKEKSYSVEAIRLEHLNAYRPWSDDEEADLIEQFKAGKKTMVMASNLKRKPGAIRARLSKLGLI